MAMDNAIMATTIFKAARGIEETSVPDLMLSATSSVDEALDASDGPGWERRWKTLYESQARLVLNALEASLPHGTMDQVLTEMLRRKSWRARKEKPSWRPILWGLVAAALLGVGGGVALTWLPVERLWTTRW